MVMASSGGPDKVIIPTYVVMVAIGVFGKFA